MPEPNYSVDNDKVKKFDELLAASRKRYPNRGYGAPSYDMPGLKAIVDIYLPIVRSLRQGDRRHPRKAEILKS
jgi:hypothetical protein